MISEPLRTTLDLQLLSAGGVTVRSTRAAPSPLGWSLLTPSWGARASTRTHSLPWSRGLRWLQPVAFLAGQTPIQVPRLNGILCLDWPSEGLTLWAADVFGPASTAVDLTAPIQDQVMLLAGSRWGGGKAAHRDPQAGGVGLNLRTRSRSRICP